MGAQHSPRISVVIPTYQGDAWITECLDSLAEQTLAWSDFEAVVIQNGPPTRTRELVEAWHAAHPGFQLQLLTSEVAGVSRARNLGLDAARGTYVTFLDDDDRLAPATLAALLAKAAPDVVVATTAGFVADGDFSRPNFQNWYALALLRFIGRPTWNRNLSSAFTTTWGKLVETELARAVRFDERLTRIGEDRVFWLSVLAARQLRVELITAGAAAAVLYRVRQESLSVRADSLEDWDRDVTPWLDTAEIMHDIPIADRETKLMRQEMVTAVVGVFFNAWLRTHPDETDRIDAAIRERGLEHFRPEALRTNRARELAVVGLTPGTDASGVPLGEPLRARGAITDLIAYVSEEEAVAESVIAPVRDLLDQSMVMSGPAAPTWAELGTLIDELLGQLGSREARKPGPYLRMLSRSAGPFEHLMAACVKLSRPHLPWVAETVSAPAGAAIAGAGVRLAPDELSTTLVQALGRVGFPVDTMPRDIEGLAAMLMLALADEIVFESAQLRDETLARCESGAIARRALGVLSPRPADLAGLPAAVRRRLNDGTATELAIVGPRDEVLARQLLARETAVDVCAFPPTGTGAAGLTAAVEPVLDQLVTVELGPISWGLVGPLADAVLQAGSRIEAAKGAAYGSVRTLSTEPLEHLIGAMVRLALPDGSWVAEFGPAARRTTDVAVEGDQALDVLAAGVIEAGFAITEVPDEMSGLAELVAFALADEVVFADDADRAAALARCAAEVRERAERISRSLSGVSGGADGVPVVAVLGSCITRDNFNSRFNPGYRKHFECPLHQNQTSLISLMSSPVAATWSPLKEMSDYDRWNVDTELDKSFLRELVALRPDYLVVDFFADVHFGVVQLDTGEYVTDNRWKVQPTDLYRDWDEAGRLRRLTLLSDTEEYAALWRDALERLVALVREQSPNTVLVLHRGRNTNTLQLPDGTAVLNSSRPMADLPVEEANRLWAVLDDHAAALVDEVIDLTDHDYPSFDEHPWGPFYVHYAMDYYPRFLDQLTDVASRHARPTSQPAPALATTQTGRL